MPDPTVTAPQNSAAAPRVRGVRGIPLRAAVAGLITISMGLMAAFLIWIGIVAAETRMVADANRDAITVAQLLSARTRAWLVPTTAALRLLAQGHSVQGEDWQRTGAEPQDLINALRRELDAEPLLDAAYVGWKNGDFLLVRHLRQSATRDAVQAPVAAIQLVQTIRHDRAGQRQLRNRFLGAQGQVLEDRTPVDVGFDPRTRPWFKAATDPLQIAQAGPYHFFTTGESGISLSQRHSDGDLVVAMDVTLRTLASTLVEQRSLPAMRLALLDASGAVLASADPPQAPKAHTNTQLALSDLRVPAFELLWRQPETTVHASTLEVAGQRWIGTRVNTALGLGTGNVLLVATPFDALVAPARERLRTVMLMSAGLALLLLPLGWWGGGVIAGAVQGLQANTARLMRFDFHQDDVPASGLREVNELAAAQAQMRDTIEAFMSLSQHLASEPETDRMLEGVLLQLVRATHARAARVYRFDATTQRMYRVAEAGQLTNSLPDTFVQTDARPPRQSPRDVPPDGQQSDFALLGRNGLMQGLLLLEVANDLGHRDLAFANFARKVSGMVAVAIETRELILAQRHLFDAVIQLMASAIDAKSPYTGGHCDRVPQLATALMDRLCAETTGPYAGVRRTESERYAFHLGAWLHDCGKVTSAEHIVDKATKLELIHNRIHEIRTRFEVLWRDAEIAHLQRQLAGVDVLSSAAQRDARHQGLRDDFAFIASCNQGSEFLGDAALARLQDLATQTWERNFDRRQGLSIDEARRLSDAGIAADPLPACEPLLADRPEHRVPWGENRPKVERDDPDNHHGFDMRLPAQAQHQGELHNLCIRRGTLTDEDRFKINDHIVQTYTMLKSLPWPAELRQVPELAASHHERLDGQGYPRRLTAEKLSLEDRVMAVADIFEALTAADRPYKPPKSLNEAFGIMARMAADRHLDAELLRYFLRAGLWRDYAERFLLPAQCDAVDVAAIERLLDSCVA